MSRNFHIFPQNCLSFICFRFWQKRSGSQRNVW